MEDNLHQTIFTIPNIQLDSIKAVSFDPVNDSIITVANNKLNVQEVSSDTPDVFNIPQALSSSEANKAKMDRSSQFDRLRFLPVHSTKKMSVTHFGNVVTSYGKNPQTAIANYGFSHGTHYWEMICPNKCAGIEVGVTNNQSITEDVSNGTKFVLFEFNTSTARIICIQMDLANMEVSAWLKGNEGKKKKSSVERGTWYPCVKINELGNVAVLNTRINDDKISKKSVRVFAICLFTFFPRK